MHSTPCLSSSFSAAFLVAALSVTSGCAPSSTISSQESDSLGDDLRIPPIKEVIENMNSCERKILQENPQFIPHASYCYYYSVLRTRVNFEKGTWESSSNAFKHAFSSACIAKLSGLSAAKRLSTAHELPQCQEKAASRIENELDLSNNQFGIRLVEKNQSLELDQIEKRILEAVCSGKLLQVLSRKDGTRQKVPTDCREINSKKQQVEEAESKVEDGHCEYLEVAGDHIGFPGELREDQPEKSMRIGPVIGGVGSGVPLRMAVNGAVLILGQEKWLLVEVRGGTLSGRKGWMRRWHLEPRHGICQP